MVSPAQLCIYCKGSRNLCGMNRCPLLERIKVQNKIKKVSEKFFGPSPSIFVGRAGYPKVFVGPLGVLEPEAGEDPSSWFGKSYDEIIEKRSMVLRSKYRISIRSKSKFVEDNQLLALAKKSTDVEMEFKGKPVYRMSFSDIVQPVGPSVSLKKMKIAENVKVPPSVEKVVSDELKADESVSILYRRDIDVYKLATILSSGALGLEENKKMVPTRWSITAVDDMVAKNLLKKMREFPELNEYRVYMSEFLHNKFVILLMPGCWEFENFEAWAPGSFWSFNLKKTEIIEEHEPFQGRWTYAKQGGGYYASRFGVVEGLYRMKRQARVVVFREVYEGYVIPVGVWEVRENVRNAMRSGHENFSTLKEALDYIRPKLRISMDEYVKRSRILGQKRLGDFIHR